MRNLKFAALAAVLSWTAFSGEEASAQGYYGYPTAVPISRQYVPASNYCGYQPANCYPASNCYTQPACSPTTVCPPNCAPNCPPNCAPSCSPNCYPSGGQYGRPGYAVPGSYSAPAYSQPSGGYSTPVYYYPAETYPNGGYFNGGYPNGGYYGAPVNRQFVPGVGHFSVEDEPTDRPATSSVPRNLNDVSTSPFYDEAGTQFAPSSNVRTRPAAPARSIDNPFYN